MGLLFLKICVMTIEDLKEMIQFLPDDMMVCFSIDGENFISPCLKESGVIEFGEPCDKDGKPIEDGFDNNILVLSPCSNANYDVPVEINTEPILN